MTKEQQIEFGLAMIADAEGKPVQWFNPELPESGWRETIAPMWDGHFLYRRKPEPKVIPWTRETIPTLPFEVRDKNGDRHSVTSASNESVYLSGFSPCSYQYCLEYLTLPDGKPCGEVTE